MEKIPTAEEFWENNRPLLSHAQIAKEFAKLHVKAALEAASNQNLGKVEDNDDYIKIKKEILNAYPEENIK